MTMARAKLMKRAGKSSKKVAARRRVVARKPPARRSVGKTSATAPKQPSILVVNMIPKSLSNEENQDSEPTIAVSPANPLHIVGSAFTPDPGAGGLAPVYISKDGGLTWSLNSIVPSDTQGMTADITVSFASAGDRLYAGIIRLPIVNNKTRLNILRTDDFSSATPMKVLVDRTGEGVDQPYVQAATISGKDRLYVGDNDFSATAGKTATIDMSQDAGSTKPKFTSARLEQRSTSGQDGPPVRPAIHPDGTAYAVFHSWRTFDNATGQGTADVVVVRDDQGGSGAHPFTALVDGGDGKPGMRVAHGVKFNFNGKLGLQRTGGGVAIAVDPTDSAKVYVAYNADEASGYMLHVLRSQNRGATWSADIRTVNNALNPQLAVNTAGKVGLLYQQLTGSGAAQRWQTKFESLSDGTKWEAVTLATVPAHEPKLAFDPYLGDYDHLTCVGKDYYGVFSANNTPKKSNFPQGVVYQRNANFTTNTLLDLDNTTPVNVSIDPFFFKVNG